MAITKNTVQVNNGNTGWTRSNVLDAMEEAFADLNWNSGSQQNGVVTCVLAPGSVVPPSASLNQSAFGNCGGSIVREEVQYNHNYQVTDDGTTYSFNEFYYGNSGVTYDPANGDYITIGYHTLQTGQAFRYTTRGHGNYISTSITQDDVTVYVSVYNSSSVHLHLTQDDAIAGTNKLNLDGNTIGSGHWLFTDNLLSDIEVKQYNRILLYVYDTNLTTPLYIQDSSGSGAYDPERTIDTGNYHNPNSFKGFPSNQGLQTTGTVLDWDIRGWGQGNYYMTSTNASYSSLLYVAPVSNSANNIYNFYDYPHWDYTVPADGTRSALNLRIYRSNISGDIDSILVNDLNSSGWSDNEVFTVPGSAVGGVDGVNDIQFGVNTLETSSGANDGICSIRTANFGSGVNSFLKMPTSNRLMLRLENDGTKEYGTTYWLFELMDDYQIQFNAGINPILGNYNTKSSEVTYLGAWGGIQGLDWSSTFGRSFVTNTSIKKSYASSATPTAYPLKIVTYKAQSPQDTNFAIIQFVQTINGNDLPYLTFFLHKGTGFGQNIWDLDYVWQGSLTFVENVYYNTISLTTQPAQRYSVSETPNSSNGTAREAMYGYYREPLNTSSEDLTVTFGSNLYRDNETGYTGAYTYGGETVNYFRNNEYDKKTFSDWSALTTLTTNKNDYVQTYEVGAAADYYRPLKGLPLTVQAAPIPYYLPDDFVVIPFNITPGQAAIYPGDTVTISPSEVYEVVYRAYYNNQTTYDGITNNSTSGVLFCARTI